MKTIELKITPTSEQTTKLNSWLDTCKGVWNRGLAILEWHQYYRRYLKCVETEVGDEWEFNESLAPVEIRAIKSGDDWGYCTDIALKCRIDRTKSWDAENIEYRPGVHLVKAHWQTPPPIDNTTAISLRKPFAKSRWPGFGETPALYINDYIGCVLVKAWQNYLDSKHPAERPRYKGKRDKVTTLVSESFRGHCKMEGDRLKLPGMGWQEVSGLDVRVGSLIRKRMSRMLAMPEEYPELEERLAEGTAYLSGAALLEQGVTWSQELDKHQKAAKRQAEKILAKKGDAVANLREKAEERNLAKSIEHLCTPGMFKICKKASGWYVQITLATDVKPGKVGRPSIAIDVGTALLYESSRGVKIEHSDSSAEEQLIELLQVHLAKKQYGSVQWKRLNQRINRLRELIKRRRRSQHQYHAQWITDVNESIVVKKIEIKETVGRPLPRPDGEGNYLPNTATKAHERNRKIQNAAIGQFVALVKSKAQDKGSVVTAVEIDTNATVIELLSTGVGTGDQPAAQPSAGKSLEGKSREGSRAVRESGLTATRHDHPKAKAQAKELVNMVNTPKPLKGNRRKPKQERKVS